ncbi:hypothetical protein [Methylocucumis oryzae]|uniref:Uncharacterized protein n=1 Tax=Methylocucumis oryzae TaxID=1632867 RepID=A0A0F3IIR5_9GAMM|nr:hypothetical protein [Methylocucumis oryzae]KJV05399.1 hypothetical protein VZ94_18485 [Methylocucumis oryzae]
MPGGYCALWFFFSIAFFQCQNSLADTNLAPVFELRHTLGGGSVLTSIIKIYPDGKIHFHRNAVELSRRHPAANAVDSYAQLTPEQLNELVNVFLSLPFELSKKLEQVKEGVNIPGHSFIAYKDKYINITIEDSIFSAFLENRMGKYINLKQLLCAEVANDNCGTNVFKIPEDLQGLKNYMEQ